METQQILFQDGEANLLGGILLNDRYIICGCCGGVIDLEDPDDSEGVAIIRKFSIWVDISSEIIGEE